MGERSGRIGKMTDKQSRFVTEFLKDDNGTAAAIRAGYAPVSAHVVACNMLKKPAVADAINAARNKIYTKLEISAERVIAELGKLAFSNILDFVDEDGRPDLKRVSRDQAAALQDVTVQMVVKPGGKDDDGEEVKITRIKLSPKREALVELGKHLGIFAQDADNRVNVAFVIDGLN